MTDKQVHYAYLFEAKGIQRYILDSGPLRDLVGASDLVAGLAASDGGDLLQEVLNALGLTDADVWFSRRAGGAFMAHAAQRSTLESLRVLWRLTASLRCPGLEMSDRLLTRAQAEEALEKARGNLSRTDMEALILAYDGGSTLRFNSAAELPPSGHPFTVFNPRTGRLTTELKTYRDDVVHLDVLTGAQRRRAEELKDGLDGVARKFLPDHALCSADGVPHVFPRNLEANEVEQDGNPAFPFRRRGGDPKGDLDRRVAVVHADLSGLAKAFRKITAGAETTAGVRAAGDRIERIVEDAVRAATTAWIVPAANDAAVLPARPVVLGGDDITVILRADIALPFTCTLLEQIEDLSRQVAEEGAIRGFDHGLSACAGIALIRAGQPFLMANALAEDLCKFAKKTAKKAGEEAPYASLVAFHNAQSTLRESYDDIVTRELTAIAGVPLTANPYGLGRKSAGASTIGELTALARALAAMPGTGQLVDAGQLLFTDPNLAQVTWNRWRQVQESENKSGLDDVDTALGQRTESWALIAGRVTDALDWIDFGLIDALERST